MNELKKGGDMPHRQTVVLGAVLLAGYAVGACAAKEPVDYVNPMIGTHDSRPMQFPGAALPFGMVKLSPDNQETGWKAGHDYHIKNIAGFNFIHDYHITGFYVMPVCGEIQTQPGPEGQPDLGYRSRISYKTEQARPGYYSVMLDDYGIKAELSTTMRTGIQRYTFPKSDDAAVLFDLDIPYENKARVLDAKVTRVSNTEIEGYIQFLDQHVMGHTIWLKNDYTIFFVACFDKPFQSLGGWKGGHIVEDISEITGKGDIGCFVRYKTRKNEQINVHTAISMVSLDQARLNLDTDTQAFGYDFDAYVKDARQIWHDLLGRIIVAGDNEEDKIKFYTNLYRTYCTRTIWSDVNGKWMDMNEEVAQAPADTPVYGCDSFWGMRWNLNGLWSLVNPSIMNSWVKSLLEIYRRGGWLPKGPTAGEYTAIMTSSPAVSLICAAYQQGIRDYDIELAYEAVSKIMKETGRVHKSGGYVGYRWLKQYTDYGYVPHEAGPASATMELAFQDWCVAQMAKDLGKHEDYDYFQSRSLNYRNQLDSQTKYARTKSTAGDWIAPFEPFSGGGFIEGNPWQYTFYAPHDVQGIINFLGKDEFLKRLNWGFESSRESKFNATGDRYAQFPINHGNQPNMQAAFLFNYAGAPWQTQRWSRAILDIYYGATPIHGWPGDEDQGQMGAWYVMSSLGLFQMQGGCGMTPVYDLGSPLFEKATIKLENGKLVEIAAKNNSAQNVYVQSATLNGRPLDQCWLSCADIQHGGKLEFVMGPAPNKTWGTRVSATSISQPGEQFEADTEFVISIDGLSNKTKKKFLDPVTVRISSSIKNGIVKYTVDGTRPDFNSKAYTGPFELDKTTIVHARVFNDAGGCVSPLRSARLEKVDYEKNLTTGQSVSASSHQGELKAEHAVDGYVDIAKFWSAAPSPQWWQLEFNEVKEIKEIHLFTYWDGWRHYQYTIDVSLDGRNWTMVVDASANRAKASKDGYRHRFDPVNARYVRVNMLKNSANPGVHIVEFRAY